MNETFEHLLVDSGVKLNVDYEETFFESNYQ